MSGMPKTSFFVKVCPNPLNFDTYVGCSHRCSYCLSNFRAPSAEGIFTEVRRGSTAESLRKWIGGERGARERWVSPDWRMPICWGRSSDPFQPMERETGWSLECLEVFAETKYPFIVTTKGTLLGDDPYLSLVSRCNCVVQVSMIGPFMDRLEKGAPPYEERLECARKVAASGVRVVARWQPLFIEPWTHEWRKQIPRLAAAGVYGVLVERLKYPRPIGHCTSRPPHARLYTYGLGLYDKCYKKIREACHAAGLKFLTGDAPRFSDSLECCGTEGLGWEPNLCTTVRRYLSPDTYAVRDCQRVPGTGCAMKNCNTHTCADVSFMEKSFCENIESEFCPNTESVFKTGESIETRKRRQSVRGKGVKRDEA